MRKSLVAPGKYISWSGVRRDFFPDDSPAESFDELGRAGLIQLSLHDEPVVGVLVKADTLRRRFAAAPTTLVRNCVDVERPKGSTANL